MFPFDDVIMSAGEGILGDMAKMDQHRSKQSIDRV